MHFKFGEGPGKNLGTFFGPFCFSISYMSKLTSSILRQRVVYESPSPSGGEGQKRRKLNDDSKSDSVGLDLKRREEKEDMDCRDASSSFSDWGAASSSRPNSLDASV